LDIKKIIRSNIDDENAGYLMIIYSNNNIINIFNEIIEQTQKKIVTGMKFVDDLLTEEYASKEVSKIQRIIEEDIILILKDMDIIYPNLFDLFNQTSMR